MKEIRAIRKITWSLIRPFLRLVANKMPVGDAWERSENRVAKSRFGPGCIKDWPWYFERESDVMTDSVEDICRWLNSCKYVHDREQFDEHDFWLHLVEFEATRKGDCEDHALWAWRKLNEIGMPAEFVRGEATSPEHGFEGAHAWVQFTMCDCLYVMETTAKGSQRRMIIPHHVAKQYYCPEVSVDGNFKTYTYAGSVETLRAKLSDPAAAEQSTASGPAEMPS